jgi:hypothetical protein
MVALVPDSHQLPLIHFIESDDLYLQDQGDVLWFDVLSKLDYRLFQNHAARYYQCLWRFNQQRIQQRSQRRENPPPPNPESQPQATQRLLHARPTLDKQADVLHQSPAPPIDEITISPQSLRPHVTPARFAGRPPKCFFALLRSFLGVMLAGQAPEPEFVDQKLRENPAFARCCGFTLPRPGKPRRQSDLPSLRKLQQFDQIMTENGLWGELALDRVADNLRTGVVQEESTVVHDTTHYHAYSEMKVVDLEAAHETPPIAAQAASPPATSDAAQNEASQSEAAQSEASQGASVVTVGGPAVVISRMEVKRVPLHTLDAATQAEYQDNQRRAASVAPSPVAASPVAPSPVAASPIETPSSKPLSKSNQPSARAKPATAKKSKKKADKPPKKKRKSHPRTTKNCRCEDREHCDHAWINADAGAGTVVKSTGKMYWAHKASTLSFARQEVLLDAVALNDAASHDSQSLAPHLSRLFARHPDLKDIVKRVLDDGAADDPKLKAQIKTTFGVELLAPINPRRRGPIRGDLPRGIDHLTSRGTPVCQAGYPFELLGFRQSTERFIFTAPTVQGESVCSGCALRDGCYRGESGGRRVTVAADRLPWLDRQTPQLSKRFAKAMARRTVIERIHKLMKFDYGDDRLTKRGTTSFQARLDKTLLAMHILLAHEG